MLTADAFLEGIGGWPFTVTKFDGKHKKQIDGNDRVGRHRPRFKFYFQPKSAGENTFIFSAQLSVKLLSNLSL